VTIRCAVIGAGVIGACIALRLSRGGAAVTVIEAAGPGAGATGKSFAWIGASAPGLREPEPYFRLNALGVHAYRRLEAECDLAGTVTRTGCLTWSTDGDGQEAVASTVGHLREVGYNAITLPAWRAARDLEPAISVPDDNTPVAFYADEGYVSGPPFVGRVLSHAQAAGAALIMDDPAAGFEYSRGGAVTGVQLR
jgi:glycine/D-amino acid oxidase-like deaminating enzyme